MTTKTSEIRIGDLAKSSGIAIETLRFYEQRGLITPSARRSSGYRIYSPETLHRLHFIQRAKALGFSLEEIRQLLTLNQDIGQSCHDVRQSVVHKISEVEQRLRDLTALHQSLLELLDACDGSAPVEHCPILQSLRCHEGAH